MAKRIPLKLHSRIDEFSYQVSAENDRMFWFRLERRPDRDVITDFSVGTVARLRAASALRLCYSHLGLAPRQVIVFQDILACKTASEDEAAASKALRNARRLYGACGRAALISAGVIKVEESLQRREGKYDLVLQAGETTSA